MLNPNVVKLLELLKSPETPVRERAAREVTDIEKYKDRENVEALVRGLCSALLKETNQDCMQAELDSLGELKASHSLGVDSFEAIAAMRPSLEVSLLEYFDELFEADESPRT